VIPVRLVVPAAVAALALLAWVLLRLCRLTRRRQHQQAARLATTCAGLWLVGLLLVTLGDRPRDAYGHVFFNWVPFATHNVALKSELVINLMLFTPAGLLLPWIAQQTARARLLAMALTGAIMVSSLIEVVQTFTPLGTAGDITDVLLNTSGCVVAAAVAVIIRERLAPSSPLSAQPNDLSTTK
jgi:glycopeptide antibiotics resistance protein